MKAAVLVGRLGAAHGVRGEIRLQSFTADPAAIATYGPLFDASGARRFVISSLRSLGKDMFVARLEGVADRGAAEALTGVELHLPREALPPPEEDEFYLADLEGLRAETRAGETLGVVIGVRNFGAGDILEIAPRGGGETLLLPFTRAAVPVVDVSGGRVVVEPPSESDELS
jgi:16S rRNA processing protein RimM